MNDVEIFKAILDFMNGSQKIINEYWDRSGFNVNNRPVLKLNEGRKYFKVIRVDSQKGVHCFVDKTNGDVLKAASWSAPAKHARGNVLAQDNGLSCMTPFGAVYLK